MAYMNQERKAERATAIKAILKKYGQKGSLSVRNHSTLCLKVKDTAGMFAADFAAGADYVMMGGYFAKAFEAETHVRGDGTYWGGASHKQQILSTGKVYRHSEGKEVPISDELKPLEALVDELWGGISSAVSYGGYDTLTNFIGNGVFEIKQNSLPPRRD